MTKRLEEKLKSKGIFKRTLGAMLMGIAGLGIFTGCPNPYTPIKNNPPVITELQSTTINEGTEYNQTFNVSDKEGDKVNVSMEVTPSTPSWLSLVQKGTNSYEISGTNNQVKSDTCYTIKIDASDGNGTTKEKANVIVKYVPDPSNVSFKDVTNQLEDMNEEQSFQNLQLPLTDSNGKSVTYPIQSGSNAQINYSINNTGKLTVTGNPNETGNFQVPISYNDNGVSKSTTLDGYLYNLLDVSGQLQNLTHDNIKGILRFYNSTDDSLPVTPDQIIPKPVLTASDGGAVVQTNPDGTFSFRIKERADPNYPPLSTFTIKAGGGNYVSASDGIREANSASDTYIRTITLQNLIGDVSSSSDARMNPAIRVSPYVDINNDGVIGTYYNYHSPPDNSNQLIDHPNGNKIIVNPTGNEITDFVAHKEETNGINLHKDNIKHVYIFSQNPVDKSSTNSFSGPSTSPNTDQNIINQALAKYNLDIHFNDHSDAYTFLEGYPIANPGWLLIIPDRDGQHPQFDNDEVGEFKDAIGTLNNTTGGSVYLQGVYSEIIRHEVEHGLFAQSPLPINGHAYTLGGVGKIPEDYYPPEAGNPKGYAYTIMSPVVNPFTINYTSNADYEVFLEAHEETYQTAENTNLTNGTIF